MAADNESQKECHCSEFPENEGKVNFGQWLAVNCYAPY